MLDHLEKIYKYLSLPHCPDTPDFVLVLGNTDLRVPAFAAAYCLKNPVDHIIISGGFGKITQHIWNITESRKFAEIMIHHGIPREIISHEEEASNTGENIEYSKRLIEKKGIPHREGLLITKPYMIRRAYNTAAKKWGAVKWGSLGEPLSLKEYLEKVNDPEEAVQLMVGDLQRIKMYGKEGFQIPDHIPEDVWEAYQYMVNKGYTKFVLS